MAEIDDALVEKYLETGELTEEEVKAEDKEVETAETPEDTKLKNLKAEDVVKKLFKGLFSK